MINLWSYYHLYFNNNHHYCTRRCTTPAPQKSRSKGPNSTVSHLTFTFKYGLQQPRFLSNHFSLKIGTYYDWLHNTLSPQISRKGDAFTSAALSLLHGTAGVILRVTSSSSNFWGGGLVPMLEESLVVLFSVLVVREHRFSLRTCMLNNILKEKKTLLDISLPLLFNKCFLVV